MKQLSYFAAPGIEESLFGRLTHDKILRIEQLVCSQTGETPLRIKIRSRTRNRVLSRYMIFYFLRKYTKLTLAEMGHRYGLMDHSTVIHGIDSLQDLIDTQPLLKKQIEWIDSILKEDLMRLQ